MRITTFAQWNSINDFIAGNPADRSDSFECTSEVALCDRAAQGAAKRSVADASSLAGTEGTRAGSELGELSPFYQREMKAEHLYDPTQINELLTAAGAPIGAAAGQAEAEARGEAARTGNATGLTKTLQEMQRDKMKAAAGASEGIAAQDVMGAKNLNQAGAAGEAGLYGENLKGQLGAMGVENQALENQINAGKSGWFQNMTGMIGALRGK